MANKKIIGIWSAITVLGAILVTLGNGCSGQMGGFDLLQGSPDNGAARSLASDIDVIPGAKTVSVVYSNQVLDQLSSCVGVTSPSDATKKMFEEKKGAISTYGTADSMNPAMMMAIISIAGEVCNDLINQEITAGGRIFKDMDLKSNSIPTDASLTNAISRLALSCWNRNQENTEQQTLLDMVYNNVTANEQAAARKSALMICTSMLSSLDSLLN